MKKNYNQPIVEATELIVSGQALCVSPTPSGLPISGSGDPIPGGNSGD